MYNNGTGVTCTTRERAVLFIAAVTYAINNAPAIAYNIPLLLGD